MTNEDPYVGLDIHQNWSTAGSQIASSLVLQLFKFHLSEPDLLTAFGVFGVFLINRPQRGLSYSDWINDN